MVVSATLPPVPTGASLCYSSTQSSWTSINGGAGGAVGGGFTFSAGPVACPGSSSSAAASSLGAAFSDAASPGESTIASATSDAHGRRSLIPVARLCVVALAALSYTSAGG